MQRLFRKHALTSDSLSIALVTPGAESGPSLLRFAHANIFRAKTFQFCTVADPG